MRRKQKAEAGAVLACNKLRIREQGYFSMSMKINSLTEQRIFCRKVQGIAATLLPYELGGQISVEAFQRHLADTHRVGLMNAVNMDTGYVNYLGDAERQDVLRWTTDAVETGVPFVAGAYIEGQTGDMVSLYRRQMDAIVSYGATPILFQTSRLRGKTSREKVAVYQEAARGYSCVLAFELGSMFASNGEIFDEETFLRLMDIPEIKGLKHSSLDRLLELDRLSLRDAHRPDFRIYTGNDLGINLIEYRSDYLLGLSTFAPEKFAERDRLWEKGDAGYYALSDAFQHLGNVAFRHPVPAYKQSAAVFLHLTGRIPSRHSHPYNVTHHTWYHYITRDFGLHYAY